MAKKKKTAKQRACAEAVKKAKAEAAALEKKGKEKPTPDIIIAAKENRVADVEAMLAKDKFLINARDKLSWTPLMEASFAGHLDMVKLLVRKLREFNMLKNVNFADRKGWTALIKAAFEGHIEVIKELVRVGNADVNVTNKAGYNALMHAVGRQREQEPKYLEVTKVLIQYGSDVNIRGHDDFTALIKASNRGNGEIVKELLKGGARPDDKTKDGQTALMRTALKGHKEAMFALLKYEDRKMKAKRLNDEREAMEQAEIQGKEYKPDTRTYNRAFMRYKDKAGKDCLQYAIENRHSEHVAVVKKHLATFDKAWGRRGWLITMRSRYNTFLDKPAEEQQKEPWTMNPHPVVSDTKPAAAAAAAGGYGQYAADGSAAAYGGGGGGGGGGMWGGLAGFGNLFGEVSRASLARVFGGGAQGQPPQQHPHLHEHQRQLQQRYPYHDQQQQHHHPLGEEAGGRLKRQRNGEEGEDDGEDMEDAYSDGGDEDGGAAAAGGGSATKRQRVGDVDGSGGYNDRIAEGLLLRGGGGGGGHYHMPGLGHPPSMLDPPGARGGGGGSGSGGMAMLGLPGPPAGLMSVEEMMQRGMLPDLSAEARDLLDMGPGMGGGGGGGGIAGLVRAGGGMGMGMGGGSLDMLRMMRVGGMDRMDGIGGMGGIDGVGGMPMGGMPMGGMPLGGMPMGGMPMGGMPMGGMGGMAVRPGHGTGTFAPFTSGRHGVIEAMIADMHAIPHHFNDHPHHRPLPQPLPHHHYAAAAAGGGGGGPGMGRSIHPNGQPHHPQNHPPPLGIGPLPLGLSMDHLLPADGAAAAGGGGGAAAAGGGGAAAAAGGGNVPRNIPPNFSHGRY